MKTTILAAAAATVLGMVGGTAWTVATHEPAPAPAAVDTAAVADTAAMVDTAAVADAHVEHAEDSTATGQHHDPTASRPDAEETTPAASGAAGTAPAATAMDGGAPTRAEDPMREPPVAGSGGEAETQSGADQLARIFTAMQPRDAARVLGQLTDAEIREILTRMGARQAAAVLSNMAPERAAVLSRTVLAGEGTAP